MKNKKLQEDYEKSLRDSFDRWQFLYEHGGSDPSWSDGVNLNLVRNHIIYGKRNIEENMEPDSYPEIYYRAVPPEVSNDYMARTAEIRETAKASLALYLADKDYQFLARCVDQLNPADEKKLCVRNVLNYAVGLKMAIKEDDLVAMRRHRNPDSYLSSFASCAEKIRNLKSPENEQISLFHFSADYDEQYTGDEEWEM